MIRVLAVAVLVVVAAIVLGGWVAYFALFGEGGPLAAAPFEARVAWVGVLAVVTGAVVFAALPDRTNRRDRAA